MGRQLPYNNIRPSLQCDDYRYCSVPLKCTQVILDQHEENISHLLAAYLLLSKYFYNLLHLY